MRSWFALFPPPRPPNASPAPYDSTACMRGWHDPPRTRRRCGHISSTRPLSPFFFLCAPLGTRGRGGLSLPPVHHVTRPPSPRSCDLWRRARGQNQDMGICITPSLLISVLVAVRDDARAPCCLALRARAAGRDLVPGSHGGRGEGAPVHSGRPLLRARHPASPETGTRVGVRTGGAETRAGCPRPAVAVAPQTRARWDGPGTESAVPAGCSLYLASYWISRLFRWGRGWGVGGRGRAETRRGRRTRPLCCNQSARSHRTHPHSTRIGCPLGRMKYRTRAGAATRTHKRPPPPRPSARPRPAPTTEIHCRFPSRAPLIGPLPCSWALSPPGTLCVRAVDHQFPKLGPLVAYTCFSGAAGTAVPCRSAVVSPRATYRSNGPRPCRSAPSLPGMAWLPSTQGGRLWLRASHVARSEETRLCAPPRRRTRRRDDLFAANPPSPLRGPCAARTARLDALYPFLASTPSGPCCAPVRLLDVPGR